MHAFVPCATQSEAGRAAVCQGCPGRELCLKQGEAITKIPYSPTALTKSRLTLSMP